MPRSERNGERHEVHWSAAVAQSVRRTAQQAAEEGRGDVFLAALRSVIRRLRRSPADFGEPLFRLPAMRMQVRCAGIPPLFVHFAVTDDQSLVFIRGITLMPPRRG